MLAGALQELVNVNLYFNVLCHLGATSFLTPLGFLRQERMRRTTLWEVTGNLISSGRNVQKNVEDKNMFMIGNTVR